MAPNKRSRGRKGDDEADADDLLQDTGEVERPSVGRNFIFPDRGANH